MTAEFAMFSLYCFQEGSTRPNSAKNVQGGNPKNKMDFLMEFSMKGGGRDLEFHLGFFSSFFFALKPSAKTCFAHNMNSSWSDPEQG